MGAEMESTLFAGSWSARVRLSNPRDAITVPEDSLDGLYAPIAGHSERGQVMKRGILAGALVAFALALASGCVVRERCAGAVWVEGHHGPHGEWHRGHWRCASGVIYY